jgi:hypothetical protein
MMNSQTIIRKCLQSLIIEELAVESVGENTGAFGENGLRDKIRSYAPNYNISEEHVEEIFSDMKKKYLRKVPLNGHMPINDVQGKENTWYQLDIISAEQYLQLSPHTQN